MNQAPSSSNLCYLWPRHDILQLIIPLFGTSGRPLSLDVAINVSHEIYKVRTPEYTITYTDWLIIVHEHLKWPDACVQLFWDMLLNAIRQFGSSWQEFSNNDEVDVEFLILFLVMHTQDNNNSSNKVMSPNALYDAVWPGTNNSDINASISNNSNSINSTSEQHGFHAHSHAPKSPSSPSLSPGTSPRSPCGSAGLIGNMTLNTNNMNSGSNSSSPLSPPSSKNDSPVRPTSPSGKRQYSLCHQGRSVTQNLKLLQDRLHVLVRAISSELERPTSDKIGIDDHDDTVTAGGDYIISRRAVDRLGLFVGGGVVKTQPSRLLSTLHPIWVLADSEAAGNLDVSVRESAEMRVSSSLTVINDGETGSILSSSVLEWLEANLTLNEILFPNSPPPAVPSEAIARVMSPTRYDRLTYGNNGQGSPLGFSTSSSPSSSSMSWRGSTNVGDGSPRHPSPFPSMDQFESNISQSNKGIVSGERPYSPTHSHSLGQSKLPHREIKTVDYSGNGSVSATLIEAIYNSTYIHVDQIDGSTDIDVEAEDESISKAAESSSWACARTMTAMDAERLSHLHIRSCVKASIYYLGLHASCMVTGCADSTLMLGVVGGVVVLSGCERLHITCACRKLVIRNCLDCTFNCATLAFTTVSGDCRGLQFGPFNTSYRSLVSHLELGGLEILSRGSLSYNANALHNNTNSQNDGDMDLRESYASHMSTASIIMTESERNNYWNKIYDVNTCLEKGSHNSMSSSQASGVAIDASIEKAPMPLPPESIAIVQTSNDYHFMSVPFENEVQTASMCAIAIPCDYHIALESRRRRTQQLRDDLLSSTDNNNRTQAEVDTTAMTSDILSGMFNEWLIKSGKGQVIMDLIKLDTHFNNHRDDN